MNEILSWSGSMMLAVCAIPAAYSAWRAGSCDYDKMFLNLWFGGEILLLIYAINTQQWALVPNYIVNILAIGILKRYNYEG